jgi:hypothetical protein
MKHLIALAAVLALAGPLASAPASAVTAPGPASTQSVTFDTALAPQYFGAGEYDGVLQLSISPDGSVNGWYRPVDAGMLRTVIGGLDGDRLWLSLGFGSPTPYSIYATYDAGKIVGSTYFGNQVYTFTATPKK